MFDAGGCLYSVMILIRTLGSLVTIISIQHQMVNKRLLMPPSSIMGLPNQYFFQPIHKLYYIHQTCKTIWIICSYPPASVWQWPGCDEHQDTRHHRLVQKILGQWPVMQVCLCIQTVWTVWTGSSSVSPLLVNTSAHVPGPAVCVHVFM